MRIAICVAVVVIVAGCTTKTVEREIYYVPVPDQPPLPATNTPFPLTTGSVPRSALVNLAFCGRFFAVGEAVATDDGGRRLGAENLQRIAQKMAETGVRAKEHNPALAEGVEKADAFLAGPTNEETISAVLGRCIAIASGLAAP